jgi:hypothetical protein
MVQPFDMLSSSSSHTRQCDDASTPGQMTINNKHDRLHINTLFSHNVRTPISL